jgi:hypothetical protein
LLDEYRGELETRFPNQIAALYERLAEKMLAQSWSGRGVYQSVAEYLRSMQRLGHGQRAQEIVQTLKLKYPKRRALHEELDRV